MQICLGDNDCFLTCNPLQNGSGSILFFEFIGLKVEDLINSCRPCDQQTFTIKKSKIPDKFRVLPVVGSLFEMEGVRLLAQSREERLLRRLW
jgi:hypothetical protein